MTEATIENHAPPAARAAARRKMSGRPRLAPEYRRTGRLDIRMSPEEIEAVRGLARAAGVPLARYARSAALGLRVQVPRPAIDVQTAAELGRIGNVLNQAVRLAHSGRTPGWPADELARLHALCVDIGVRLNDRRGRGDGN